MWLLLFLNVVLKCIYIFHIKYLLLHIFTIWILQVSLTLCLLDFKLKMLEVEKGHEVRDSGATWFTRGWKPMWELLCVGGGRKAVTDRHMAAVTPAGARNVTDGWKPWAGWLTSLEVHITSFPFKGFDLPITVSVFYGLSMIVSVLKSSFYRNGNNKKVSLMIHSFSSYLWEDLSSFIEFSGWVINLEILTSFSLNIIMLQQKQVFEISFIFHIFTLVLF